MSNIFENEHCEKSEALSGVIGILKPEGMSSASVDYSIKAKIASLLSTSKRKAPKVGHGGTLDPFATGVLILGIGSGTKSLHHIESDQKEYLATICLGISTDSDDLTGEIISQNGVGDGFSHHQLDQILNNFRGVIEQRPSDFSAKRVAGTGGKRAYQLKREGFEVVLAKKQVEVFELELLEVGDIYKSGDVNCQNIKIRIVVSAGTYIRSIARDLGQIIKVNGHEVGGHLIELQRTKIGKFFSIENCLTLENALNIQTIDEFNDKVDQFPNGTVISLGNFDGVHLGHQKLIQTTVLEAKKTGSKSVCIVIDDFKDNFIYDSQNNTSKLLTTIDYRLNLIRSLGVDIVKVLDFKKIKEVEYSTFFQQLIDYYSIKKFILTKDISVGKNRSGNFEILKTYFNEKEISFDEVRLVKNEEKYAISSTLIRKLISEGEIRSANQMLGKEYKLSGIVKKGFQRGRKIGFPTANLDKIRTIIPQEGVYFGTAFWTLQTGKREKQAAMISIGTNPTFEENGVTNSKTVEVHIPYLMQNGIYDSEQSNLYDKELTISFATKMRDMKKFHSVDKLIEQLSYDSKLTTIASKIHSGSICVIPTDTQFGLVGQFGDESVAEKIYQLKQRSNEKKLQVLVKDLDQAMKLTTWNDKQIEFAKKYWPGAVTIIVGGIGFRVPKSKTALDILNLTGPLFATSANISGNYPADNIQEIEKIFQRGVDFYFDGILEHNVASTVVSVSQNGDFEILRQGQVAII